MNLDVIIVGAGAAGLMAARELARAGKKVLILEARDRIGGRIMPLDEEEFDYPAQGGAEFVHGEAPITRALIQEAGLALTLEEGDVWSMRDGGGLSLRTSFANNDALLKEKLASLTEDVSLAEFLKQNFSGDEYATLRNSIIKATEGYDAADINLVSTLMLKEEWLGHSEWDDGRITEGYTALLNFLKDECEKYGVEIRLTTRVVGIDVRKQSVLVRTSDGTTVNALKIIVTVPLPILKDIEFNPALPEKFEAASEVGFGHVIKVLIRFKTRWWENIHGKDLSRMSFLLSNEKFLTWWTQYPLINTTLTGWMSGPIAAEYREASNEELLDIALESLSNISGIEKEIIEQNIILVQVFNWPGDRFSRGAYSYTTYKTGDAYERLREPYADTIFFAGEALPSSGTTATVEGALESGLETARRILNS